jgi:hypothetical protein
MPFGLRASTFKGKDLNAQTTHTIHFGKIIDGHEVVDEVLASVFIAPKSYTREDVVEISSMVLPTSCKRSSSCSFRKAPGWPGQENLPSALFSMAS